MGFTLLLIFLNVPYFEARVTALSCQWLMGQCTVNSVNLPDGSSCSSGVCFCTCQYFYTRLRFIVINLPFSILFISGLDSLVGVCGKMQVSGGKQMCRNLYQYV